MSLNHPPNLKDLREAKEYSQAGVAGLLGITRRQYQRYEYGDCTVPVQKLIPLARELSVPVEDLLYAVFETDAIDATQVMFWDL